MNTMRRASVCRRPALAGFAFLLLIIATQVSAAPPDDYLPVFGGPTFSPAAGGYQGQFSTNRSVNNNGVAIGGPNRVGPDPFLEFFGSRAVRWDSSGNPAVELNHLGTGLGEVTFSTPTAINDSGVVVGTADRYSGRTLAYAGTSAVRWEGPGTEATPLGGLGGNSAGISFSYPTDINAAGTAVGYAEKFDVTGSAIGYRPIRWDAGSSAATELETFGADAFGSTFGYAGAINDAGTAVGYSDKYSPTGIYQGTRAVRWHAGGNAASELPTLSSASNLSADYALAINSSGAAVGYSYEVDSNGFFLSIHPVRWSADGMTVTALDRLGLGGDFDFAYALDINDAGDAIGLSYVTDGQGNPTALQGLRWDGSGTEVTALQGLATFGQSSSASRINAAGIAVGTVGFFDQSIFNVVPDGAVYWGDDGVPVDLNTLIDPLSGWYLLSASAISDSGWITGYGQFDPDGFGGQPAYDRLFLMHVPATAVPEPGTFLLVFAGVGGLMTWGGRRQRSVK